MIEFEEYNNYMLHIACSNKKLIDDEELNRKREKQQKQEETELKRINTINEREERFNVKKKNINVQSKKKYKSINFIMKKSKKSKKI